MKKLKIGVIGVGRLGYEHTRNIANSVPGMELSAICDMNLDHAKAVANELNVSHVYSDPAAMCANPEIDAVAIFTNTSSHVDMIRIAMEAGKHVFCEKPLAETVEKCREAEEIVEQHPNQIFMLGFMRRFDRSYEIAKEKIDHGDIGKIVLIRSYSQDPRSTIDSYLKYAPKSGGQFIDMSIHDIDLMRWFSGSDPAKLWAIGGCFEFPQHREWNDGDNVSCLMQMKNDVMCFFFANRTAADGAHVETEIVGTRGTIRIGSVPSNSLVEILSEHGVCRECYPDFVSRWHDAYIREMGIFCQHINEGTQASPTVYDGTAATRIAFQCKKSFIKNELLELN